MNNIKGGYTRQEIISEQAQKAMERQNAIINKAFGLEQEEETKEQGFNNQQDTVTISLEAQRMMEELERIRESNEDSAEAAEIYGKCMMIAMRVASGDKVPQKDIKFLLKHNPGLYAKAMEMRMPKPDPKEHESVLSEEDEKELSENPELDKPCKIHYS